MDSKVKLKVESLKLKGLLAVLFLCAVFFAGCKQNDWLDWKVQNELWLEQNKTLDSVEVSSTGLQYKIIADPMDSCGEAMPNTTSIIYCDYTVKLITNQVIDQGSYVKIPLSSTVPGFAEGCHKIHNQGDIELYVPAYLGYDFQQYSNGSYYDAEGSGTEGTTGYIPPYSTLIFTVHICAISE